MNDLGEQFGRNLAAMRREAGFTQDRLAAETCMGRNTLTRLEQGHSLPRLDQMVVLAGVIDVQLRDLLYGIG
jgi:transcriptional regulator with XRE-family HTH domain